MEDGRDTDCEPIECLTSKTQVDAPAKLLWSTITDLDKMPGIHPRTLSAHWLDGTREAGLGARFESNNVHDVHGVWQAICQIVAYRPYRKVAWTIESDIAPPAVCRLDILDGPDLDSERSVLKLTYCYDKRPGAEPPVTHAFTQTGPEPSDTHGSRRPR